MTASPPSVWGRSSRLASCALAMSATMDRPSPRPSGLAVRSGAARWKGSSRRLAWCGGHVKGVVHDSGEVDGFPAVESALAAGQGEERVDEA